jgi:hypothetical protein
MVGLYSSATEALEVASAGCTLRLPVGVLKDNLVVRLPVRIVSWDSQGTPYIYILKSISVHLCSQKSSE